MSHETRSESLAVGGLTWLFDSLQSYGSYLKERLLLDVQAQITSESFWATFFSHTTALEVLRMWKMPHNVHHFSYCRLMKQHEASFFGRHIHKCKMLIKSSQISILTFRQKEGRSWLDVRYHRKKKKISIHFRKWYFKICELEDHAPNSVIHSRDGKEDIKKKRGKKCDEVNEGEKRQPAPVFSFNRHLNPLTSSQMIWFHTWQLLRPFPSNQAISR